MECKNQFLGHGPIDNCIVFEEEAWVTFPYPAYGYTSRGQDEDTYTVQVHLCNTANF